MNQSDVTRVSANVLVVFSIAALRSAVGIRKHRFGERRRRRWADGGGGEMKSEEQHEGGDDATSHRVHHGFNWCR
jgi:hypothetical protein